MDKTRKHLSNFPAVTLLGLCYYHNIVRNLMYNKSRAKKKVLK
jgi:hypothetical protein